MATVCDWKTSICLICGKVGRPHCHTIDENGNEAITNWRRRIENENN